MADSKYCYPDSNVLKNKLNITNEYELFEAEKELTAIRLKELQDNPLKGKFDYAHLKNIHKYIFQDIYEWAGEERTVEIGKGNFFCPTIYISSYANSIFNKYFSQCYSNKDNISLFIKVLAENYGDLNALHPFREGNGRAQREFAQLICLECGYKFSLSCTTHKEMLTASKLSFDKAENSKFIEIFTNAITPIKNELVYDEKLNILTIDDLSICLSNNYDSYGYEEDNQCRNAKLYEQIYQAKIDKMNAEKRIEDAKVSIKQNKIQKQSHKRKQIRKRNEELSL